MPSAAPRPQGRSTRRLQTIGASIRRRRRQLGITAMATASAAGLSRATPHRIETGAGSVTLGALMNVLDALELSLIQLEGLDNADVEAAIATKAESIELALYPLLQHLAWHVQGTSTLSAAEAAGLYTRHRRRLDLEELQPRERQLIASLTHAIPQTDVPA